MMAKEGEEPQSLSTRIRNKYAQSAMRDDNVRFTMELQCLNQHVLPHLRQQYEDSKDLPPRQRYTVLKTMIKTAIEEAKPGNLTLTKKEYTEKESLDLIKDKQAIRKALLSMSRDRLEIDTEVKRYQIKVFRSLEHKYQESKGLSPLRRYFYLKRLVKTLIFPEEEI